MFRIKKFPGVSLLALSVMATVLVLAGCNRQSNTPPADKTCAAEEDVKCGRPTSAPPTDKTCAAEADVECEGHEEREGQKEASLTIAEILNAKCEHGIFSFQCDECRYEVGVVKFDASLIRSQGGSTSGLVEITRAAKKKMATTVNITGEVRLNENATVHISPRIAGILKFVRMDLGAQVQTNEVLFEIESVELGQALSDYDKSRALAALSQKNFEREKTLFEQKIGSETEMIASQMAFEEHASDLKAAEQKLHVLGLTEADISAISLENHARLRGTLPMRAPIAGTIIEKHAVAGELVEAGRDVMVLADLSTLWVWGDVYERDLAPLLQRKSQGGIPMEVSVRAFPGRVFHGMVDYIGATMDHATRTVKVRAMIENKERMLRAGMFCEARVHLSSDEDVLAIPRTALLSDEGKDFVFTLLKDDYYVRRPVKKGREVQEHVEILEGLEPGQVVVAQGAFLLKSDVLRSKMGAGCAD